MDNAKRLYEALFMVDTAQATADFDGTVKAIETIFERADAEVLSIRKWDERRLAYNIKGKERGTYFLCYFKAPTGNIAGIERDVQLSEVLMRVLVLRGDHLTAEVMGQETPAMTAEREAKEEKKAQQQEAYQEDYDSDNDSDQDTSNEDVQQQA